MVGLSILPLRYVKKNACSWCEIESDLVSELHGIGEMNLGVIVAAVSLEKSSPVTSSILQTEPSIL